MQCLNPSESHPCHQLPLTIKDQIRLWSSAHLHKRHEGIFITSTDNIKRFNVGRNLAEWTSSNPGGQMQTAPWRQMTLRWSHVSAGQWLCTYFSVLTLDFTDRPLGWSTAWLTDFTISHSQMAEHKDKNQSNNNLTSILLYLHPCPLILLSRTVKCGRCSLVSDP